MGYYGDEKRRQMVRSILPCSAGSRKRIKGLADKRRRKNRRNNNELLHRYSGGTADQAIDMYDDLGEDFEVYIEMHHHNDTGGDIVQDRRDQDKLNPFVHWGIEITKHMEPWERMDYIRSILPKGAIGDHGMLHLDSAIGWDPLDEFRRYSSYREQQAERKLRHREFTREVFAKLREIGKDDHKRRQLNAYLVRNAVAAYDKVKMRECQFPTTCGCIPKDSWHPHAKTVFVPCTEVRTINGYHDTARFIEDIFRRRCDKCSTPQVYWHYVNHRHTDWLKLTLQFLEVEVPEDINLDWFRVNPADIFRPFGKKKKTKK